MACRTAARRKKRPQSGQSRNGVANYPYPRWQAPWPPPIGVPDMSSPSSINPRIIEGLYCEALVLSDEVRAAFALSGRLDAPANEDEAQVALSCEALRTTTRMMHAVAWLLNHRAYFAGDLSEFQLRRHGRLAEFPEAEPHRLALIDHPTRELIQATERFHARLKRLDNGWRERDVAAPSAIAALRERLGERVRG
jgi:regulator of CtrA degradation